MWITNILLFLILNSLGLVVYYLMLIVRKLRENDEYEEYSQEETFKNNKSNVLKMYDCFICKKSFTSTELEQSTFFHNLCSKECFDKYKGSGF